MTNSDQGGPTQIQDLEALSANMAQLFDTSQKIWQLYAETHKPDDGGSADPYNVLPVFANLSAALAQKPEALVEASVNFWTGQMDLWTQATNKMLGADPAEPAPNRPEGGRRFSHPGWSENALFEYIKRSYLMTSQWTSDLVHQADDMLDPQDRKKADLITRNFVEALNPANFFALNPEVLEATMAENGENLVRGAQMMLEDMQRGKGDLLIRQTDMDAFKVGENMAISPGKVIWRNNILELIQYEATTEKVHETPLLFIPPWINKYYVLDLNEKKSMIKWLVAQGHTVFMISWVNPGPEQKDETWESYMFDGASAAIDRVLEETRAKKVNLASYCIGGTLTGSLMAYLSKKKDRRVKSTTLFTAQLDFEDAGELQAFVDEQAVRLVDENLDTGFVPAQHMAQAFNCLRANDLIWSYVVSNYMLGKEPFPFDLLYWNSDSTAMPARVHHFYLEEFYIENKFTKGTLPIRGETLCMSDIKGPVYHIATVEDHIAPAASVYRGAKRMTQSDITFVLSGSGHIAGVVNPPALGKYQYWVNTDLSPDTLDEWRDAADMQAGSWWPHWSDWLAGHSARQIKARVPGKTLGVLCDAPGSFVAARFDAPDA